MEHAWFIGMHDQVGAQLGHLLPFATIVVQELWSRFTREDCNESHMWVNNMKYVDQDVWKIWKFIIWYYNIATLITRLVHVVLIPATRIILPNLKTSEG